MGLIPFERSYWVLPNKLLAGEIPAARNGKESIAKLNALIECGIDLVINLMEEDERNYSGELFFNYSSYLDQFGVEMRRFPIKDLSIPTEKEMKDILLCIDTNLANGKKVYVHCWGGVGRTGTVVGCYLLRHSFATPNTVISTINYLKRTTSITDRDSPETEEQRSFLMHWTNH